MDTLTLKIDMLEGHSRRNNLRFGGILGQLNEPWSVTEEKVRMFIKDDLNRPDLENVEIERAHRVKSVDSNKCTIMVKLSKFKEREQLLQAAKTCLQKTDYFVKEDFTNRVNLRSADDNLVNV